MLSDTEIYVEGFRIGMAQSPVADRRNMENIMLSCDLNH